MESSSDRPPTVVEVEGSSDRPPTVVEVEGSSDRPPTVVEVEGSSVSSDPHEHTHTSPTPAEMEDSPPPYQAQINGSNAGPPPYIITNRTQIIDASDRPPVQALRNGSSYGGASIICVPAAVENRPFKSYGCYLSVAIVLMCLSLPLVNPVAFMLAVGALVHVLVYRLCIWSGF